MSANASPQKSAEEHKRAKRENLQTTRFKNNQVWEFPLSQIRKNPAILCKYPFSCFKILMYQTLFWQLQWYNLWP